MVPAKTSSPTPFLTEWQFTKEKKGVYHPIYLKQVPISLVGHTGVIIAVQAPEEVLGPPADQSDEAYVKYGDAIIRLDSGEIVQTALYASFITSAPGLNPSDAFALASVREQKKNEAISLAQRLSGKSLYLTELTHIYDMGLTVSNIGDLETGIGDSDARIINVPLLTPIPILETRYSTERGFTIVLLKLPDGRKAQYVLGCVAETLTPKRCHCASTSMPTFLTDREVEAIRKGSVYVGMSEAALYMSIGLPKETNASLVGHTQLVYHTAYIYLDENHKVIEVQSHD